MAVVVFSYTQHEAARRAADQLTDALSLTPGDVSLGTHAIVGGAHDGPPLLAAAVAAGSIDTAVAIAEAAGGTCVEIRA